MTARTLSDEQELDVVWRYAHGWTERQLADRFGVPRPAIQRCLDKHQVERRPIYPLERRDDVDTERIVRLRHSGLSWARVAQEVGMKPSGVRRRYDTAAATWGHGMTRG